jgi:sporulation related protein
VSLFNRKQESDFDGQQKDSPGKSKASLLVLLVLVGGFGYLYFFTSLIVPHEVPSPPPATVPEVKKSMPPKPGEQPAAPAPAAADAAKPEAAKPAAIPAPAPAAQSAAPAKPAPAVAPAKPAPAQTQAAAKPAPAAPAPAQPQAAVKPAPAPPAPAPAKKEAQPAVKKEEAPAAKPAPAKPAAAPAAKKEEPGTAKAALPAAEKPAVKKKAVTYTIAVGDFPAGEEAAAAEAKLAKLKIKPVTKQALKKSRKMTRLFLGAYTDYDAYTTALEKLKQSAKGAFGVEKDGKYSIYAASFSSAAGAEKEKKLLQAKGVSVQLQQVVLPLSTVKLGAGHFASKVDAEKAAARLKAEGLAVKVVPAGK